MLVSFTNSATCFIVNATEWFLLQESGSVVKIRFSYFLLYWAPPVLRSVKIKKKTRFRLSSILNGLDLNSSLSTNTIRPDLDSGPHHAADFYVVRIWACFILEANLLVTQLQSGVGTFIVLRKARFATQAIHINYILLLFSLLLGELRLGKTVKHAWVLHLTIRPVIQAWVYLKWLKVRSYYKPIKKY